MTDTPDEASETLKAISVDDLAELQSVQREGQFDSFVKRVNEEITQYGCARIKLAWPTPPLDGLVTRADLESVIDRVGHLFSSAGWVVKESRLSSGIFLTVEVPDVSIGPRLVDRFNVGRALFPAAVVLAVIAAVLLHRPLGSWSTAWVLGAIIGAALLLVGTAVLDRPDRTWVPDRKQSTKPTSSKQPEGTQE